MTQLVASPPVSGTHALVVGVGEYPWLDGGTAPRFSSYEGMGQLSSPPESARAVANWMLDASGFNSPSHPHPLATLELLLSDAGSNQFTPPGASPVAIERATYANVEAAIRRWFQNGNADPNNLLVFFFCGHGIARGLDVTLLPEDYGSVQTPPQAALTQAIDFSGLYLGMDSCAARNQLYFVDACRVASGLLVRTYNVTGNAVIPGMATITSPPRNAPIYYGSVPGATAFGRSGKPSFFTEALLKAFRGAGADDVTGVWALQTDTLGRGIHHQLRRAIANTAASGQLSMATNIGQPFAFHPLPGLPECPVDVTCDPVSDTALATLEVSDVKGATQSRVPDPSPWQLDLDCGTYEFKASFAPPSTRAGSNTERVAPPYRPVKIKV